jgi:hypothetical protein
MFLTYIDENQQQNIKDKLKINYGWGKNIYSIYMCSAS